MNALIKTPQQANLHLNFLNRQVWRLWTQQRDPEPFKLLLVFTNESIPQDTAD